MFHIEQYFNILEYFRPEKAKDSKADKNTSHLLTLNFLVKISEWPPLFYALLWL